MGDAQMIGYAIASPDAAAFSSGLASIFLKPEAIGRVMGVAMEMGLPLPCRAREGVAFQALCN